MFNTPPTYAIYICGLVLEWLETQIGGLENMEKIKTRSAYWDNIKGFLMLLTVFAHILYQLQDTSAVINGIVDYIYMFHMPLFFFIDSAPDAGSLLCPSISLASLLCKLQDACE